MTYLLNCIEMVLHALDGNVLACLDALGLKHFREGSLSLFADQSVFYTSKQIRHQEGPKMAANCQNSNFSSTENDVQLQEMARLSVNLQRAL